MPAPAALAVPTAMVALKRLALQASAYYTPEVATAVTSATCAAVVSQWIWKIIPVWIKEDISFRTLFLLNYDEDEKREELSHLASVLRSLHRMTSSMEEMYEIPQLHAAIFAYMQWSGQMKQLQLQNSIYIDKTLQRDYGYHSAGKSIPLDQVRSVEHQEALEFATWAYHRDATKLTRLLQERDFQVVLHDQSTRPGYVSFYAAVSGITREIRIGVRGTSTLEDLVTDCCGHAVPFRHDDDTDERGRIEVEASRILQRELELVSSMDNNVDDNDDAALGSDCSSNKSQQGAEVIFDFESIRVEDDDSQGDNHIRCHEGILLSAQRMCKKLRPIIQTWAVDAEYRVVLCGHSLGGGAATLAGLILRAEFSNLKVQVYAFAPPPVLDHDSAIASASFVTSFVHNADMIPRCSLFNLAILLQGLKRFHERLVERGMNPTGPKTSAAFLRQLFSSPELDEVVVAAAEGAGESSSKENEGNNRSDQNSGCGVGGGVRGCEVEGKGDTNATTPTGLSNLLVTLEEWKEAIDEGTPDIRKTEHLFVPGRVLLIYSPWQEDEGEDNDNNYNSNNDSEHEYEHHDNSFDSQDSFAPTTTTPVDSLVSLRCIETDGTCPALRMIEADGPRLFTDHVSSSYYQAMGMNYQF